jgi:ubiquinone/menaquinone biosynthesis C-methylase UbiE
MISSWHNLRRSAWKRALAAFSIEDGIHQISPPQSFEGGEEEYDARIGGANRADLLRCGHGAWRLVTHYTTRPMRTVLELGAGGGTCSLGLIEAAPASSLLITDTSPSFLRLIQRKCAAAGLVAKQPRYATLAGEALDLLPADSVDAIVIASALHHVFDWQGFLRVAATRLRRGGVLAIQEPFRAGNLMMGVAIDIALSPLWPRDAVLSEEDETRLRRCRDSIYLLSNSHVEKRGEDKHCFELSEMIAASDAAGFAGTAFHSNAHFHNLVAADLVNRQASCSLVGYLASFLRDHHRISDDGMAKLTAHLFPILQNLDASYSRGDGPPLLGCMVFRK